MTTTNKASQRPRGGVLERSTLLFGLAFFVFLAAQLYLTATPILSRALPVEVDDAYGYILKAEEMGSGCFFQDCRALQDLRTQFTAPTNDVDLAYIREREYHRVFVIYHPLHSLGLLGLRSLGLSYEAGYNLLAIAGKILLCVGIGYWLQTLFGRQVGAVTLLLLTPVVFIGQGIHTIVPSNMALGLAFFAWSIALQPKPRQIRWLFFLILCMLLLHQAGKVYAVIAVAILAYKAKRPINRETKFTLTASALLVVASFLLPMFISRPELSFNPLDFYPGEWDLAAGLLSSLVTSVRIVTVWLSSFGFLAIGAGLVIASLFTLITDRRVDWLLTFVSLFGLLLASLVYVVPWFGALFFERAWIPLAIFSLGLVGQLVLTSATTLCELGSRVRLNGFRSLDRPMRRSMITAASLGLLALIGLVSFFPFHSRHYSLTLENQKLRQNFSFDRNQPSTLFSPNAYPDKSLIYMDEISLYYYLTNGGLSYGAFYYPAFESWNSGILEADYLVTANPVTKLSHNPDMAIELDNSNQLIVTSISDFTFNSVELFIHNQGQTEIDLEWEGQGSSITESHSIAANSSGWILFSQDDPSADQLMIRVVSGSAIHLLGVRFDPASETNWPWHTGVTLELLSADMEPITIEISESTLSKDLPLQLKVLNDTGYTVLAKVVP